MSVELSEIFLDSVEIELKEINESVKKNIDDEISLMGNSSGEKVSAFSPPIIPITGHVVGDFIFEKKAYFIFSIFFILVGGYFLIRFLRKIKK